MLGDVIRQMRKGKGLTLQQVADATGLSVPFISQVENEQGNPTLSTLRKIASALGTSVFALLAKDELREPAVFVIPADRRTSIAAPDFKYATYERVSAPFDNTRLQVVWVELAPGAASCDEPMPHGTWEAEEVVIVIEGDAELKTDQGSYGLRTGDSIHFRPALPHQLVNRSRTAPARFISIMSPPSF